MLTYLSFAKATAPGHLLERMIARPYCGNNSDDTLGVQAGIPFTAEKKFMFINKEPKKKKQDKTKQSQTNPNDLDTTLKKSFVFVTSNLMTTFAQNFLST